MRTTRQKGWNRGWWLWLGLAVLLAGCARTPEMGYYTWMPESPVEAVLPGAPLYVARVRVPDHLDDTRIWVRREGQRLQPLPNVRWSETPPPVITRLLQLQFGGISEPSGQPRLYVDIHRLEAQWQGEAPGEDRITLEARWWLEPGAPDIGQAVLEERLEDRQPETLAAAKTRLVLALGDHLAETLSQELDQGTPGPE